MKIAFTFLMVCLFFVAGCSGEKQVKTSEDVRETSTSNPTPGNGSALPEVNLLLDSAVTALKKDDQVAAVAALETLRQTPNLTVNQLEAIQQMRSQAQQKLAERAARGDQQAIATLRMMQMNPH